MKIHTQVVVLAGGLATRLGGLTSGRPKSLIEVHGKPFLQHQLEMLKAQGIVDVIICTSHLGDQIEEYFGNGNALDVKLKYSCESNLLGTAGALRNAARLLDNVFITIYGDSYLFLDFNDAMNYFLSQNKKALMTVHENHNRYDRSNTAVAGDLVIKYDKTENRTPDIVYIDYGVNIFRKEVLEMIPASQPYGLELLFPKLIAEKELLAYRVEKRFYEIGSLSGLDEFTKYAQPTNGKQTS
jgi:NDP-sugar pyrophosphorylase family protein